MMKMTTGVLAMVLWAACQEPSQLPSDAWVNDGDSDGDGLKDEFEVRHGLDPHQAVSFADGIEDEDRLASNGKTMWEVQKEESGTPVAGASSGGACGLIGLEGLVALALAMCCRRRP
jgi:hypothetical protein